MGRASNGIVLLLAVALGAGCNQTTGDTDAGTTDAGGGGTDLGPGSDAGMCAHTIPTSGFGTRVGAKFAEFDPMLMDCSGNGYTFYNDAYCTNELTVVTLAAGWCYPCNLEADQMESMLIGPYGPRGVRVIHILTQDDNHHVPTPAFCTTFMNRQNGWPTSAGYYTAPDHASLHVLSPTTHTTLLDPTGATQIYNPGDSIPATLIVDGDGVIQYRFNGTGINGADGTADLTEMTTCLDKLLSTPRVLCH